MYIAELEKWGKKTLVYVIDDLLEEFSMEWSFNRKMCVFTDIHLLTSGTSVTIAMLPETITICQGTRCHETIQSAVTKEKTCCHPIQLP